MLIYTPFLIYRLIFSIMYLSFIKRKVVWIKLAPGPIKGDEVSSLSESSAGTTTDLSYSLDIF